MQLIRRPPYHSLVRAARNAIYERIEFQIFTKDLPASPPAPVPSKLPARDSLSDLLKFEPTERWQAKQSFLASALRRFEAGEHAYTYALADRLLHYGWLVENQTRSFVTEVKQVIEFPDPVPVLYDFYTHPDERKRGFYQNNIAAILDDLSRANRPIVYIMARADNWPSCHVIEKMGFNRQVSLFMLKSRGQILRWAQASRPASGRRQPRVVDIAVAPSAYAKLAGAIRWRIRSYCGLACDVIYNVETTNSVALDRLRISSPNQERGIGYEPTPWTVLNKLFGGFAVDFAQFAFVDFGSGKGRVVLSAASFPFARVVGVEFSSELCGVAEQNLARSRMPRRCREVAIWLGDATEFVIPEGPCIFFFFNPFTPEVFSIVARNICVAYEQTPRPMYLAFYSGSDGYIARINELPFLRHRGRQVLRSELFFTSCIDLFEVVTAQRAAISAPPQIEALGEGRTSS